MIRLDRGDVLAIILDLFNHVEVIPTARPAEKGKQPNRALVDARIPFREKGNNVEVRRFSLLEFAARLLE